MRDTTQFYELKENFILCIDAIRELYLKSAHKHISKQMPDDPTKFIEEMENLYRGLCLKLYLTMALSDQKVQSDELALGQVLYEQLWGKKLDNKQTRLAIQHQAQTVELRWDSILKPFCQFKAFQPAKDNIETQALRFAQLIAQTKEPIGPTEAKDLRWIGQELDRVLHPITANVTDEEEEIPVAKHAPAEPIAHRSQKQQVKTKQKEEYAPLPVLPTPADMASILAELDKLIGLDNIKKDVRELINFLKMQEQRKSHNLPTTPMSLHAVFVGNPGTGKTTVARIYGQILGAMGILQKGHLIETDRGGLVAEYAGQTAGKTKARVDEAMDGVLFIDEAYSLIAEGEDPYGAEAVQTLLKRMEDQRDRLVVIIAGYPDKMRELLESNPGLSSRFGRTFQFPDYNPIELGKIFDKLAEKDHYLLEAASKTKLLQHFQKLYEKRDEHFGNGRLVRNLYEATLRCLANRLAFAESITRDLLTTITEKDIALHTHK